MFSTFWNIRAALNILLPDEVRGPGARGRLLARSRWPPSVGRGTHPHVPAPRLAQVDFGPNLTFVGMETTDTMDSEYDW